MSRLLELVPFFEVNMNYEFVCGGVLLGLKHVTANYCEGEYDFDWGCGSAVSTADAVVVIDSRSHYVELILRGHEIHVEDNNEPLLDLLAFLARFIQNRKDRVAAGERVIDLLREAAYQQAFYFENLKKRLVDHGDYYIVHSKFDYCLWWFDPNYEGWRELGRDSSLRAVENLALQHWDAN